MNGYIKQVIRHNSEIEKKMVALRRFGLNDKTIEHIKSTCKELSMTTVNSYYELFDYVFTKICSIYHSGVEITTVEIDKILLQCKR